MTPRRAASSLLAVPFAARLTTLARVRWTGALHLAGEAGGGSIYLSNGVVSYASSIGTPGPVNGPPAPGLVNGSAAGGPSGSLARSLAVEEATIDASMEVLSGSRRDSAPQLREGESPQPGQLTSLPVAGLLTEVDRRLEILNGLSRLVTADTVIARNPGFGLNRVRISALQWALLIRAGNRATPRSLAFDLERSVFGTTIEVYRLIAMELLSPPGAPSGPDPAATQPRQPHGAFLSFLSG